MVREAPINPLTRPGDGTCGLDPVDIGPVERRARELAGQVAERLAPLDDWTPRAEVAEAITSGWVALHLAMQLMGESS